MAQPGQTNPMIQAPNSLVKYASPVLVSTSGKKGKDKKKAKESIPQTLSNAHTEDILNSILPPRVLRQNWPYYQLGIHNGQTTTLDSMRFGYSCYKGKLNCFTFKFQADVLFLQEQLDKRLQQRQARETGICPIREELYAQCFDELIRQITINCAERGLLLVRVRDEIRMTIQAYQTLYESSIAFGMRKALQAEQRKAEMQSKIKQLENDCTDLQKQVDQLDRKIEEIERSDKEQQENDEKVHREQVDFLKRTNQRFKDELEKLLSGPAPQKK